MLKVHLQTPLLLLLIIMFIAALWACIFEALLRIHAALYLTCAQANVLPSQTLWKFVRNMEVLNKSRLSFQFIQQLRLSAGNSP